MTQEGHHGLFGDGSSQPSLLHSCSPRCTGVVKQGCPLGLALCLHGHLSTPRGDPVSAQEAWEVYRAFQDLPASCEDKGSMLNYGESVLNPSASKEVVEGVSPHPATKG